MDEEQVQGGTEEVMEGSVIQPYETPNGSLTHHHPSDTYLGDQVTATEIRLRNFTRLPSEDVPSFGLEDMLRFVVEAKCTRIEYHWDDDEKSATYGELVKTCYLYPKDFSMAAWTDDPEDDGILRRGHTG